MNEPTQEAKADLFPDHSTCCDTFRETGASHDPECSWWS